jgi:crotonobetainyl-CoA:carnitine CoA-transferase CaiB-like acyl-CoA transferase
MSHPAAEPSVRSGPFAGTTVLDLTVAVLGPYATQLLADLGADVIKVEGPEGDTTRSLGPGRHPDRSGMHLNVNRGKRGIVVDLKQPAGRDVLLRLAAGVDVFVHSMRLGALRRLGIDYEAVAAVNPSVVYANLIGFGRGGPYADLPAYDDVIQAATGFAVLSDEATGHGPAYVPMAACDKVGGIMGAFAIAAALHHRARTGEGQQLDVPMFEAMASFVLTEHLVGAAFDPPLGRPVYRRVVSPERRPYRTADGHLGVMIYNDGQWRRLFAALGQPEWSRDERFATMRSRTEHVDFVLERLAAELATRTTAEWLELLRGAEIPAMPLRSTDDLLTDEHLEAVGFWKHLEAEDGALRLPGVPVRFERTPGAITSAGPGTGEHTVEVLLQAGFDEGEVDRLVDAGVVRTSP